jgi:hypothetical protein
MIEAMKQALETLRKAMQGNLTFDEAIKAFTTLSQAIEQAEKHEPVAWMHSKTLCLYETFEEVPLADGDEWPEPLYTTPQPQRDEAPAKAVEWVGLTNNERVALQYTPQGVVRTPIEMAFAVEAKVKEKNI